jgi:5-methylcytosine-specific restriction endonuclease McrA
VYGHICPVVFNAEGFTETTESRRSGRYIRAAVKMRVARRDNYMCQEPGCGRTLRDFDIEFDHIIPVARGGSSEEHNLRVTCFEHNRDKGRKVVL